MVSDHQIFHLWYLALWMMCLRILVLWSWTVSHLNQSNSRCEITSPNWLFRFLSIQLHSHSWSAQLMIGLLIDMKMHLVLLSSYHPEVFIWKQQIKWLIWLQFHYQLRIWALRIILKLNQLFFHSISLHSLISNLSLLEMTRLVHQLSLWLMDWMIWFQFMLEWTHSQEADILVPKDPIENSMWRTVYHWENWLLDDILSPIIVYSIYPIFLNSEPSPLELLNNRITSIMLMMFIWLVRMSEKNHWKICLLLIRYLLAVIHLVVVIQFDLRVMIEWWNNIQIFFHLNPCHLLATHSQVVIPSNWEVKIEWSSDNQICLVLSRGICFKEHFKEMEEMIEKQIPVLHSIIKTPW